MQSAPSSQQLQQQLAPQQLQQPAPQQLVLQLTTTPPQLALQQCHHMAARQYRQRHLQLLQKHTVQLLQQHHAASDFQTRVKAELASALPQGDEHLSATARNLTCVDAELTSALPQDDDHHQTAAHTKPTCVDAESISALPQDESHLYAAAHQVSHNDQHHYQAASDQMNTAYLTEAATRADQEELTPGMLAECLLAMDAPAHPCVDIGSFPILP